jgi:hypothetical protein
VRRLRAVEHPEREADQDRLPYHRHLHQSAISRCLLAASFHRAAIRSVNDLCRRAV